MEIMAVIEREQMQECPQRIQMPIPRLRSALESDLPTVNPLGETLQHYEMPLPLHRLTVMELRRLEVSMRHLLEAFNDLRRSAGLQDVPGWLTLIATEYGFVHAALQTIPFDESDALPPL